MSTRSAISIKPINGNIKAIYCHHDGYPSGVGETLFNHYQDPDKVKRLIEGGGISSLGEKIEPDTEQSHSYDNRTKGVTVFYIRDRGEEVDHNKAREYESKVQFYRDHKHYGAEYMYLFDEEKGEWEMDGEPLAEKIEPPTIPHK